jgi:endonuclease YncB( thermonuclease family)
MLRATVAALMMTATVTWGATFSGVVVAIADGDTLTVLDAGKREQHVRLAAIDAPEKRQAFGTKAREHLAALAFHQSAVVYFKKRDRYGRIVGKVTVDGRDIGQAQIEAGMAWHYKQFKGEQAPADRLSYAAAELEARAARLGLWADETAEPPWEFRSRLETH